ncbi:APC family permease [Erythrobacter dokdonensis]|uniref:Amino acid permease n=1 Tax=Erythrobacter dokdonensis DSW-74 TaxID=1300349 RepID=A0A1A7BDC2_9SPHN|nr:APC family permease [Erythrobacter dokdonensis]OBV10494.1 Amino acid permease [Erythrobacter dokdonensis DSW-74]
MSGNSQPGQLQKRLGLPFAIAVCVGLVIGTGIMRTPGEIANMVPDPTVVMLLWLAGGLYVMLMANVAAEVSCAIPRSGGHYIPVHEALGDAMGLLVGWTMWIAGVAATAFLALAAADFLALVVPFVAGRVEIVALLVLFSVTALNWAGVEEGCWAQIVSTGLKLALLLAVVCVALVMPAGRAGGEAAADPASAEPLSILTILAGLQFIVTVYDGWYASIYFAGEDRDPGRNIPRSLFQSALLVTAIYLAINWSLIRALDFETLRASTLPMAQVIEVVTGRWGKIAVGLVAVLMALGTLNAAVMTNPRTLYGMAQDGLFVKSALKVNRGGTPTFALAMGFVLAIPLIFSGGYVFVFRLVGAMVLFASCLFVLSYFALRKHRPDLARPYRAKGHPILPALALTINLALLIGFVIAEPISGAIMAGMIAICVPVGLHLEREKRRLAVTTT